MGKNNGLEGSGFVAYKYCLLMKINEGAAGMEQSGNGGTDVPSLQTALLAYQGWED